MDADEIEIVGDLGRHEAGSQTGAIQAPVHEADRNQVPLILFPDGGGQMSHPLASDIRPGPILLVKRDELNEVFAAKRWSQPVFTFATRHHWLVHEVVTKDGGAISATGS